MMEREEKRSQLFCPRVQTHYHIKVKLCLSFFVRPFVVRRNIFNGALQDYTINKTLASLCFISLSLSLSLIHTV